MWLGNSGDEVRNMVKAKKKADFWKERKYIKPYAYLVLAGKKERALIMTMSPTYKQTSINRDHNDKNTKPRTS
jgi:hypothetical protein